METIQLIHSISDINTTEWEGLLKKSSVATWFQTKDAYTLYSSVKDFCPFLVAVNCHGLKGVVIGYITKATNVINQAFTSRAIIYGGPLLDDNITECELKTLLTGLIDHLKSNSVTLSPIYIETRNFNSYTKWNETFNKCGFQYEPHLNFKIDTTTENLAQSRIGKHRWKYIRLSIRDGASLVENPSIEQIDEFYEVLYKLYKEKVKTPLYSKEFFYALRKLKTSRFLFVKFEDHIIGGVVCVSLDDNTLYEWFACGNDNYHKGIRPSSVATWYGIQYAANNGYQIFDLMGAGKPDDHYGVRDFKQEFGGKLVEHGRYKYINKPLLYKIGEIGVKLLRKM